MGDSVETCNEKIDREIRELQKLVNWQTNKIQSFEGAAHKKGKARIKTASDESPRTPASNWGFSSLKTKESGPPTLEEGKEGVSPCDEESSIESDDGGHLDGSRWPRSSCVQGAAAGSLTQRETRARKGVVGATFASAILDHTQLRSLGLGSEADDHGGPARVAPFRERTQGTVAPDLHQEPLGISAQVARKSQHDVFQWRPSPLCFAKISKGD